MSAAVSIRKFPTRLHVRCSRCLHQGYVTVFLDRPPKLRCTHCGSRAAVIVTRDRTQAWSARRGAGRKGDTLH
jgi:hypothetical protein